MMETDTIRLASMWLETPGAGEAMRLIVALRHGQNQDAVRMAAEATVLSFLKGWLGAWQAEAPGNILSPIYREVLKESERRWPGGMIEQPS